MTNKTKASLGAAAVLAAAVGTVTIVGPDAPDAYKFNGFAEVVQARTVQWEDGTNKFECDFRFNPDRVVLQTNIVKRGVPDRSTNPMSGRITFWWKTNEVEEVIGCHPGIAMLYRNDERIGTNILVLVPPKVSVESLRELAAVAIAIDAK